MHPLVKAFLFAAFSCIVLVVFRLREELGLNSRRLNHMPGPCRVIPGIECGSEDIAVSSEGLAFISSGLRHSPTCDPARIKGSIFLFDFNNPNANVTKLQIVSNTINPRTFDPHGVSLYQNTSNGDLLLFVVDHSESQDVVRRFEFRREDSRRLHHIDDVRSQVLLCLNDIVSTGPRSFYASNYAKYCRFPVRHILETFLLLKTGSVAYFDGVHGRLVADSIRFANGINLSPAGDALYVTSTMDQMLYIYNRSKSENSIQLKRKILINIYPDNLDVDIKTGDIFLSGHVYVLNLLLGLHNRSMLAPTNVVKIHPFDNDWKSYELNEVLFNTGWDFVRGSSIGAFYDHQLLIGTVFDGLGYCQVARVKD